MALIQRKAVIGPSVKKRDKLAEIDTGKEAVVCDEGQPDSLGRIPVRTLGATFYVDPERLQEAQE